MNYHAQPKAKNLLLAVCRENEILRMRSDDIHLWASAEQRKTDARWQEILPGPINDASFAGGDVWESLGILRLSRRNPRSSATFTRSISASRSAKCSRVAHAWSSIRFSIWHFYNRRRRKWPSPAHIAPMAVKRNWQ